MFTHGLLLIFFQILAVPIWLNVPFVSQPKDGCGAASILMVMQYWDAEQKNNSGPESNVAQIKRELYSPKEHGITSSSMQWYLQQHGFIVFTFNGTWVDLMQHLKKGRPLIVAIKPEGQSRLHYIVIDGIDPEGATVTMNDPSQRKLLTEERARFEKEWSAANNWTLLAIPSTSSR